MAVVRRLEPDLVEFTFAEDEVSDALTWLIRRLVRAASRVVSSLE